MCDASCLGRFHGAKRILRFQNSTQSGNPSRRWRSYHRLVWEAEHGPVPRGHVVIFKPGQFTAERKLITRDKLELVSRRELMKRNSYHNRYPKEIGRLIQLRGALMRQIKQRERNEEPNR